VGKGSKEGKKWLVKYDKCTSRIGVKSTAATGEALSEDHKRGKRAHRIYRKG